jgi:hypothetical protein
MNDKPTHKQCRQCLQWFSLKKYARPQQKFCTLRCAAEHRNSDPEWRAAHSQKMKAKIDPEVMRERAREQWRDPDKRARVIAGLTVYANSKEHLTQFAEQTKKLWADPEFRRQHSERTSKMVTERWSDPAFRQKISAMTSELNKQRWADPKFKRRTGLKIRIALAKKRSLLRV